MIRRTLPLAAVSLLVTLATGCSMLSGKKDFALYSGPELAQAQVATVIATEEIQLLALDGKELSGTLFGAHETRFSLLPGEHVLSLRYSGFFQQNTEYHDVVRSKPLALRFVAQAGETYRFDYQKPRNVEGANQFVKNPELTLVAQGSGERVKTQLIRSFAEASLVDTIGKAFQTEETQLAVRGSQLPASAAPSSVGTPRPVLTPTSSVHYDLLRDLWLRASPEERVRFQQWTLSAEAK